MKHILLLLLVPAAILLFASAGRASSTVPERFARSRITDPAVRYAYDQIRDAMLTDDPQDTFSLDASRGVDRDALVEAINLFLNDTPECFWLTGGFTGFTDGSGFFREVTLSFQAGGAALRTMRKDLEEAVGQMLAGVSGSPWEMALILHDRLIDSVTYVHSENDQNAYGALVQHRSVCTGYAAAYQLLLNRVGIEAYTVVGEATNSQGETELHAWTLCFFGPDYCVYTDVTWDDHETEPYHYWFCRSLDVFAGNHFPNDSSVSLPACSHSGLGWYELGHGLLLTDKSEGADAAPYFTSGEGDDLYTADLCCETPLEDWLNTHVRELIASLGYLNAEACGYRYHYQNSGSEYRITLEVQGGTMGIRPGLTPETQALPEFPAWPDPVPDESTDRDETSASGTPTEKAGGKTKAGTEGSADDGGEDGPTLGSLLRELLTGRNLLIAGAAVLALILFCSAIAAAASRKEKR